jgi:NADPH:quinone reductase-like Zn-dependent oxidoreductase
VEATGPGVRRFAVGDAVVGLRDLLDAPGTHAETVVLDERAVAPAPRSVPLEVAATLPLDGLTADGALRRTGARAGDRVLVTGAGGGVGGFVLQLAALRGIETVAVVRPGTEHRIRRGSATHVIASGDPLGAAVRAVVRGGVDAVIDAAVLGIEAHAALRAGGTFVALVRPFAPPPLRGTSVVVHEVAADGARLTELAALVDLGVLVLDAPDVVALSAAADAHARLEAGGTGRRIVLSPSDPGAPP